MKIFLIGFMGSGKSTHGKKLALKLEVPFYDLDQLITDEANMSIPEYFAKFGETAFRQLEQKVLKGHSFAENSIIATGGGAPCYGDSMDWLVKNGLTVYISLPAEALASRLEKSKTERPVLQGRKGEELIEFIREKLAEREAYYKRAQLIVNGIGLTPEKLRAYVKR